MGTKVPINQEARPHSAKKSPEMRLSPAKPRSFYLISASRDHVNSGRSHSIVQANHGIKAPLPRMRPGDGVVFYSARHQIKGKDLCQRFTAIATVDYGEPYQEQVSETWKPWRREATYEEDVHEVDVKDVLGKLGCLGRGKEGWGVYLRRGFMQIGPEDWEVLRDSMMGEVGRNKRVRCSEERSV